MDPQPTLTQSILKAMRIVAASRKGAFALVAAIFGTIAGVFFSVAMSATYFQGKLTPDLYWTKLQVTWGAVGAAWTAVVTFYMASTAYEDRGKQAPPTDEQK